MLWEFLGYGTASFRDIKKALKDQARESELFVALLVVGKYPFLAQVQQAIDFLLQEIERGKLLPANNSALEQLIAMKDSPQLKKILRKAKIAQQG